MAQPGDKFKERGLQNLSELMAVVVSEVERIGVLVTSRKYDKAEEAIHDLLMLLKG